MRAFSQLLDDLVDTRSRNTKLQLIGDYLKETPDPDRGYGLAALTGTLDIPHVKPAAVRGTGRRADPPRAVLHELRLCRGYGGDGVAAVAEALPENHRKSTTRRSASPNVIDRLRAASKLEAPRVLAVMLDHLDAPGRYALLKLHSANCASE